ncbi:alkaline phosphatase family protein [Thauera sp.]|jgi:hypothetical protein|uniref:alkaline phosphatase family protein n=1 Tax=Thauera sp. TaxID=1905334 RepID=UPI002629CD27|nr:alkaline phosphatase family protein [Thauera sp.]MCK6409636.1 alkaline phosphatase family protein [Thauera sp.]
MNIPKFPLPTDSVLPDYDTGGLYGFARSLRAWLHDRHAGWAPAEIEPGERALVVLIVIDGLGDRFLCSAGRGSALHGARRRALTSVLPSTTASAVTTLNTGVAPAEHGLNGWFIHDRRFGGVIAPLPLVRRSGEAVEAFRLLPRLFPVAPMYHHACRPVTLVSPAAIAFSRFSLHHGRGAHIEPYRGLDDFAVAIVDMALALGRSGGLIHAYYPTFDALSHTYGSRSDAALACFARIDAAVAAVRGALGGRDVRLVVTADHGFIDAPPERCIDLTPDGEVAAMLAAPLFGERRLAFCRVREDAQDDFEAWAAAELGGKAVAIRARDCLDAGLLGPGKPHARLAERLGSHVLLMESGWTIVDHVEGEHAHTMIGVHGGLTADEMLVPLIVART